MVQQMWNLTRWCISSNKERNRGSNGAKISNFFCSSDVFLKEGFAAVVALEFAADMGFQNIVVEGDSNKTASSERMITLLLET